MTLATPTSGAISEELPYRPDSAALFEALADLPWAVFLDSGHPFAKQSKSRARYDILTAEPVATLVTRGANTEIHRGGRATVSTDDPLKLLRSTMRPPDSGGNDLPFTGGAIGYFAYDLGRRWTRLPTFATDALRLPDMAVGIYDWALVVDHERRRSFLAGGRLNATRARWRALAGRLAGEPRQRPRQPFRAHAPLRHHMERQQYDEAFRRVQSYIRAGDCYQVNLAQRLSLAVEGDSWLAYRRLRASAPAPHGAYLNLPFAQILSNSPEGFLRVTGDVVETRPIKGTAPRGADAISDRRNAELLRNSAKDRAENVMIVDLLRNDLGKVCRPGTVTVPSLCVLESFPSVHHLVSEIRGRLAPEQDALDLLCACFPGGSVTGAPKRRAMEIIEELEPERRGVYCGAIGYLGDDGGMDTSIAIRTAVRADGQFSFHGGGGIVADSGVRAEYQETLDKVAAFLRLLALDEPVTLDTNYHFSNQNPPGGNHVES